MFTGISKERYWNKIAEEISEDKKGERKHYF